jgi:2'-5' RNA ligase
MAYATVLSLSQNTAARVVKVWEELARASISSVMLDLDVQPHISLAVCEVLDPALLRGPLQRFAETTRPLSLELSSLGTFPTTEGVVFLAPVVTQELLEVHHGFHGLLQDLGIESAEYYRPGNWVPHCTVALDVAPDQLGAAMELCLRSEAFGPAELNEIGMIEFLPVDELCAFPLGGQ